MSFFNNVKTEMDRMKTETESVVEKGIDDVKDVFESAETQAAHVINDLDNSVSTALAELSALETKLVGEVESRTSMLTQVRDRKAKLQSIVPAQTTASEAGGQPPASMTASEVAAA